MRVLHVTTGNLYGGVETCLMTLARSRGLCPEMEPSFAVCFRGRLWDELTAAGVPVYQLRPTRVSRPWTVLRARGRPGRRRRPPGLPDRAVEGAGPGDPGAGPPPGPAGVAVLARRRGPEAGRAGVLRPPPAAGGRLRDRGPGGVPRPAVGRPR